MFFLKPSLTELVLSGVCLSRTVREVDGVYEELVGTDREEDVVQVEEPGHVDWLAVESRSLPGSLPAAHLHQDSPAAPVPHLHSALKYLHVKVDDIFHFQIYMLVKSKHGETGVPP